MRTGAIFARGSCRALKWVAACMMAMALGAGQAHADITASEAVFAPGGNTVVITPVGFWGTDAPAAAMDDFTVSVEPAGGGAAVEQTITSIDIGSVANRTNTITLTLSAALPSGADVVLAYDAPAAPGTGETDERISSTTGGTTVYISAIDAASPIDVYEMDRRVVPPSSVPSLRLTQNRLMDPTTLPAGSEGNGELSYDLWMLNDATPPVLAVWTAGTLEVPGLTWIPGSRLLYGTPTTEGKTTITYRTTDQGLASGRLSGVGEFEDKTFTIEVVAAGTPAGTGTTLTNATLAIDAQDVVEGTVNNVNVVLSAEVPAGTESRTEVKVTVMVDPLTDATELAALRATKAEDGDYTVTDPSTSNADPTMSTVTFTFPANTSRNSVRRTLTQSFQLQTLNHDADAEDEGLRLSVTNIAVVSLISATNKPTGDVTAANGSTVAATPTNIKIDDDETQGYTLTLKPGTSVGKEGAETTLVATADPVHVDGSATMSLHIVADPPDNGYTVTPMVTVGRTAAGLDNDVDVTITTPDNDGNRSADEVTVTMAAGTSSNPGAGIVWTGSIADAHALPSVEAVAIEANGSDSAPQPTEIDEGQSLRFVLRTAKATTEDIRVALEPGGGADAQDLGDYRLLQSLSIDHGNTESAPFELTAVEDDDVGAEELVLTAVVSGDAMYGTDTASNEAAKLAIIDKTMKQVMPAPKSERDRAVANAMAQGAGDDGLNPDPEESFTIAGTALFTTATGYTAEYSATSSDSGVATVGVSGGSVTVTAKKAGSTTITVSANASMASSSVTTDSQTVANRAEVMIPVEVKDKTLVVEVTTDAMNGMVDEGGMLKVTATSTARAVMADENVTVMLAINGPVEGEMERSIAIAPGETMGYVDLMVSNDDMVSPMADIVITASGPGITGAQVLTVSVTEDDMAPPETTYTLTASADMVTEGGDAVTITATASAAVAADTMIELVHGAGSASADDYSLEPMMITIAADGTSGMAMLTATANDGVEGDETLTLEGRMGNMVVGSVMLTIADTDVPPEPPEPPAPTVRAKDDAAMMIADAIATAAGGAAWMVGGMVATVDMSTLFDIDDGVTAVYAGKSSDDSVVSATVTGGSMLALTPMGAGMATIEVTGTDTAGGGTDTVMHDAAVVLQTLSVMVTASATAVDEGGMVTLTAEANRAVTEATTITLTLTGDTAAVTVEPAAITIAAGSDSGTATVTAVEDDDAADANVAIVATGPGMTPTTINIAITDNDPTVSGKSDAEVTAVFTTAVAMAGGASGWLPGWRRGRGRHERAVHDQRQPDPRVHGHVVGRGHGRGQRQRVDADADADGHR